jgi:hypothetical protein
MLDIAILRSELIFGSVRTGVGLIGAARFLSQRTPSAH